MKTKHLYGTALGFFLLTFSAGANPVPLVVGTYNFALDGGGGSSKALLNGVTVQIFCDDFNDEIYVPSTDSANVTTLGTGVNLGETRFGDVASNGWTSINLSGSGSIVTTDDAFFNSGNGSSVAARYDMVAYLVSLYNLPAGNTTSNNQIQEAIWTLMDPKGETVIDPSLTNPTTDLEQAASWYLGGGATNAFLTQFEVVSDATMTIPKVGVGVGGFQEQIVFTPTPEPRGSIWMLIGLFGAAGFVFHKARARKFAVVA
jgi:hypothetical protein